MRSITDLKLIGFALLAAGILTGCAKKEEETRQVVTDTATESKQATVADAAKVPSKEDIAAANERKAASTRTSTVAGMSEETRKRLEKTIASSFGKGSFKADDHSYNFTIEGSMLNDKSSHGAFRFYSFMGDKKMDVAGDMTCVHIDSKNRRIWMAGEITENKSTDDQFTSGKYATGSYVQFRARPNSLDGKNPAAIEKPNFIDQAQADTFCQDQQWSDDALIELGPDDLIAAIP